MKLLVNTPEGKQEVIVVGEGGGYFDPSRVLWDERQDGPLPEVSLGGMVRDGDTLVLDGAMLESTRLAQLTALTAKLSNQIDAAVAAVYERWLRFDAEYVAREAAARAFIASGTASPWVSGFAGPAGLSDIHAANLIVLQADTLRGALVSLGALRMRKYAVKAAATADDAQGIADDILTQVASIAESLP